MDKGPGGLAPTMSLVSHWLGAIILAGLAFLSNVPRERHLSRLSSKLADLRFDENKYFYTRNILFDS